MINKFRDKLICTIEVNAVNFELILKGDVDHVCATSSLNHNGFACLTYSDTSVLVSVVEEIPLEIAKGKSVYKFAVLSPQAPLSSIYKYCDECGEPTSDKTCEAMKGRPLCDECQEIADKRNR